MADFEIFGLCLGAALIGIAVFWVLKRHLLKMRCTAQVVGTVIGTDDDYRAGDGFFTTNYYVEFRYSVDGVEYVKNPRVSGRQCSKMKDGQEITVFYDPSKPKRCYVKEIKFRIGLTISFIIIGACCIWTVYETMQL